MPSRRRWREEDKSPKPKNLTWKTLSLRARSIGKTYLKRWILTSSGLLRVTSRVGLAAAMHNGIPGSIYVLSLRFVMFGQQFA